MKIIKYIENHSSDILIIPGPLTSQEALAPLIEYWKQEYNVYFVLLCDGTCYQGAYHENKQLLKLLDVYSFEFIYGISTGCNIVMELMESKLFHVHRYIFESPVFFKIIPMFTQTIQSKLWDVVEHVKDSAYEEFAIQLHKEPIINDILGEENLEGYRVLVKDMYQMSKTITKESITSYINDIIHYQLRLFKQDQQKHMCFLVGVKGKASLCLNELKEHYPHAHYIEYQDYYCGLIYHDIITYLQLINSQIKRGDF